MMKKIAISLILSCGALTSWAQSSLLSLRDSIEDNDIVSPTSFETDYEELQKNWYIQNYTDLIEPKESRSIATPSDQVYIERLKRLQNEMGFEIELPFNNVVKSYIEMYTSSRRRRLVENMLGMWLYYEPIFEEALAKEGMPLELKYLPIIESALNPNAVSPAGAAGLWQFILSTGRGMGLEVNSLVDERRDTYKASQKAAEFLKSLYKTYDDWSLAIAAYNCGPGNVNKAIRRSGGSKKDYWEIYNYLPRETRGYVPAFIAAAYVMNYHNEHGISAALAKKPLLTDTVHVCRRLHFDQISKVIDLESEALKTLNPQYRKDIIPGSPVKPYVLILPSKQVYSYLMSENTIGQYEEETYAIRETAEPGVSRDAIKADSILVGDSINVYTSDENGIAVASTSTQSKSVDSNEGFTSKEEIIIHEVRRGETLKSIANKYGTNTSRIKKENNLTSNTINRGQKLQITVYKKVITEDNTSSKKSTESTYKRVENPKKEKNTTADKRRERTNKKTKAKSHTVKSGESLDRIAHKYGVSVNDLKKANNIKKNDNTIHPGDKLKIPSKNSKSSSNKSSKSKKSSKKKK
ncbi:MAG: LysM peptidoglycan-binding domain-containing protein [Muribaculaceae bacterium]|nr:LysM peptidoglycan-binding domain-containing protein [Muribaculaceae bacterium]